MAAKGRFISYIAFQISPEIITINYKTYRKTNATVPLVPAPQKAKERNQNQAHTPYSVSLWVFRDNQLKNQDLQGYQAVKGATLV